jgi:hypothetical protein
MQIKASIKYHKSHPEWLKLKLLIIPNLVQIWKQQKLSTWLMGMKMIVASDGGAHV